MLRLKGAKKKTKDDKKQRPQVRSTFPVSLLKGMCVCVGGGSLQREPHKRLALTGDHETWPFPCRYLGSSVALV